ncbi:actin-like protein [Trypanosoma rangeli]|uniref:Actin-like protein n=1 Tax=Trypanosoma rangeli TaxID=5698 RepID=A0A3R7M5N2_TRYRA|nr:actin-like protein [Trypanosoma rangeli]RNF09506.1 actin-like protein [Trypanosoma rangeli]|eukprot:RNF09506.1 actin-like protein [Trypanosoma rangeli]
MPHHQHPIAVLDVGSCNTRLGFGGEEAPRVVQSTIVGTPQHCGVIGSLLQHHSDTFAGEAAWERRGLLNLSYPVQGRRIVSYTGLEHILHDALYTWLPVVPNETPLLWVEPVSTSREDREHICELFFEAFDVPLLAMTNAAAASVYSTGRTSGLVLDSGEDCTTVNAIWEGYNLQHAFHSSSIAGRTLTDRLFGYLRGKGYALSTADDRCLVEKIKRSCCYVAANAEVEMMNFGNKTQHDSYELPDEQHIYLQESQFMVPELLFHPLKDCDSGGGEVGWAEAVTHVVRKAPPFTQSHLLENVVLGGGNTLFPGIEQRLRQDMLALNTNGEQGINCIAFPDRDLAAWVGASVVASMPTFSQLCLSRKEYYEKGAAAMHVRA